MNNKVLVTLKGKPIITVEDLEKEKEKIIKINPQIQQVMDFKEINRNILGGLVDQKIIDEYIVAHKINETAEYRARLNELYRDMECALNTDIFSQSIPVSMSEEDVKSFYEKNKDTLPGLMMPENQITGPEDSKYIPYEQIKSALKKELEKNKRAELCKEKINVLAKEYDVEVDSVYGN